jgi:hypothetical protein
MPPAARLPAAATLLFKDDDALIGTWDDFFLLVWRRETTLDAIAHANDLVRRFRGQRAAGIGLFTVIAEGAPRPSADARRALAKMLESGEGQVLASVVVFEGDGFRAAAVRAVVTGLTLLARSSFPHRVFESRRDAARWLVCNGSPRWLGRERGLVNALDELGAGASPP